MIRTFVCEKCGWTFVEKSKESNISEKKEHSKNCSGEFVLASGLCFPNAVQKMLMNPSWLFCYGEAAGEIEGQSFTHAWNEFKGIEKLDGSNEIIFDENGKEYVADFSNPKNPQVLEKIYYYRLYSIKEKDVKKLKLSEVLDKISNSIKKNGSLWGWIFKI